VTIPFDRPRVANVAVKTVTRAPGVSVVFLAALAPMVTVPAIRRLVVEEHGGSPALVHVFVAMGMIGSAIGAPLIASKVDSRGGHLHVAAWLASIDALVQLLTSYSIPTSVLFLLRPIHGMASMGLLALLFAQFRGSKGSLVTHAGAAMIAALAIGPALGGILSKIGYGVPFRVAAAISAVLAVVLFFASAGAPLVVRARQARRDTFSETARPILAPLLISASQRFAIGGFVAAFAVQARAVHGLSDAKVGMCFSTLLVVFALAMMLVGRMRDARKQATLASLGAVLFGAAFVGLAVVPTLWLPVALACAGVGAALVYGPCLAFVSAAAVDQTRTTSMALLHAAGAVGMIAGALVAAAIDLSMRGSSIPARAAAFMTFAGVAPAVTALVLAPRLRKLAAGFTSNAFTAQGQS